MTMVPQWEGERAAILVVVEPLEVVDEIEADQMDVLGVR